MVFRALVAAALMIPFTAVAQTTVSAKPTARGVVLRQVFVERDRAFAEGGDGVTREFVATFSDRSQCALKVIEWREKLVSLDISSCAKKSELLPQTILEPSLFFESTEAPPVSTVQTPPAAVTTDPLLMSPSAQIPVAAPAPTPVPPSAPAPPPSPVAMPSPEMDSGERVRVSLGAGISLVPKVTFETVTVPGSAGSYEVEFQFEGGFALSGDLRYQPRNNWGFIGGIGFETYRELKSLKTPMGNTSVTTNVSGSGEKAAAWLFDGSLAYRWNDWYLPFGINYSYFQYKAPTGYTGGWELYGGMGLQIGIGCYLNKNLAIELWSRASRIRFKLMTQGVTTIDFGDGIYSSGFLALRGIF